MQEAFNTSTDLDEFGNCTSWTLVTAIFQDGTRVHGITNGQTV